MAASGQRQLTQRGVAGSLMARLTVPESALGPRVKLGQGANGVVYALQSFQLPDEPGGMVYKEYRKGAASASPAGLLGIVQARLAMPTSRRQAFDRLTVWPLRAVTAADGSLVGVLMRRIPDEFMQDMTLPSGRRARLPREVQHLIFDPHTARLRGVTVPPDDDPTSRRLICERLALVVAMMHGAGLVYGDLSARNVLYRLRPEPTVLLVDCDAARVRGSGVVNRQQDSPDWDPPETAQARRDRGITHQTQETDRYKLGLFVLRCLTPGRGSSVNRDWSALARRLDAQGQDLLKRALDGSPADRPRARDWYRYFQDRSPSWRQGHSWFRRQVALMSVVAFLVLVAVVAGAVLVTLAALAL